MGGILSLWTTIQGLLQQAPHAHDWICSKDGVRLAPPTHAAVGLRFDDPTHPTEVCDFTIIDGTETLVLHGEEPLPHGPALVTVNGGVVVGARITNSKHIQGMHLRLEVDLIIPGRGRFRFDATVL